MRKGLAAAVVSASLLGAVFGTAPAGAAFGLNSFEMTFEPGAGSAFHQAGSHPFEQITFFKVNTKVDPEFGVVPDEDVGKFLDVELPEGFVGDPFATPRCAIADYLTYETSETGSDTPACPNSTAVGIAAIEATTSSANIPAAVFNLEPPPGMAAKLGFVALDTPVTIATHLSESAPYNVVAAVRNVPQRAPFYGSMVKIWGVPMDSAHDPLRGSCRGDSGTFPAFPSKGSCASDAPARPFLTMPRSCTGPYQSAVRATSWQNPDAAPFEATTLSEPGGLGCSKVGLEPEISSSATTRSAESPSGLSFELKLKNDGLINPSYEAVANSDLKQARVALPEGVTINPSQAIGLQTCTPAQFAGETANSAPAAGCPEASKIGTTEVETPLLEGELLKGSVYVAQQDDPGTAAPGAENPFDSLIALYMTVKSERRGINVKLAGKVEPDPVTGQIVTTFGHPDSTDPAYLDLPQLPFSNFRVRLREGGRSPLVTPAVCGDFQTKAEFTPWSNPNKPVPVTATTTIDSGVGGGPCPPGGTKPFEPGFDAGTANNNAGSYSPFLMRLQRRDGDQDLTRFDSTLPPGALAKLAGVDRCSDAAIASIKTKTGKQELASPSCPANSKIGNVWGGAGAGSQLVYVPGSVYLAGPFDGAPLSVVGVVPAVAGPFDVGVVMTRQALVIDPVTGVASVDGEKSDPIPHILEGIPLRVRDIQVRVDRPDFTLNPTNCDPLATTAAIWGGGQDVFSAHDDSPVGRAARFQAANCANLGFNPRINLQLFGGTTRAKYQAVRAVVRPRPGHANIAGNVVRFPTSAFVAQENLNNICTRVQWAAEACPKGSVYGNAIAYTPLLDFPLRGTVHLRSSTNLLPDLVADLRGPDHTPIKVEVAIKNDSVKGALRATVQNVPDAPVTYFRLQTFGGKKGLVVNSRNICRGKNAARVTFRGQNGKRVVSNVPVRNARCAKQRKRAKAKAAQKRKRMIAQKRAASRGARG